MCRFLLYHVTCVGLINHSPLISPDAYGHPPVSDASLPEVGFDSHEPHRKGCMGVCILTTCLSELLSGNTVNYCHVPYIYILGLKPNLFFKFLISNVYVVTWGCRVNRTLGPFVLMASYEKETQRSTIAQSDREKRSWVFREGCLLQTRGHWETPFMRKWYLTSLFFLVSHRVDHTGPELKILLPQPPSSGITRIHRHSLELFNFRWKSQALC